MADPIFTLEDDYVTRANPKWWFQGQPGALVQTPDGRLWTIVSYDLTGWGVIEGDHPEYIGKDGDELVPPTHMLRDAYNRSYQFGEVHVEFLGEVIRIIRKVKPDGSVEDRSALLLEGAE